MIPEPLAGGKQARIMAFAGQICHCAVKVHGSYRVACHFTLFAHRKMRLVVFVGARPECPRVFPTLSRLDIIVMGLLPAFVDKILAETQVTSFPGSPVQFYQREFDLFMTGVASFLPRFATKNTVDVIGVAR